MNCRVVEIQICYGRVSTGENVALQSYGHVSTVVIAAVQYGKVFFGEIVAMQIYGNASTRDLQYRRKDSIWEIQIDGEVSTWGIHGNVGLLFEVFIVLIF